MDMEQMQSLLARQQSRIDIMNLMGRYQYYPPGGEVSRLGRGGVAGWVPEARCGDEPHRPGAVRLVAARCPVRVRSAGRIRRKKVAGVFRRHD